MAISPITAVSYTNSYNKVNFGARKHQDDNGHRQSAPRTFMKSVPLAVLLAMSPLNSVQAQQNMPDFSNEKVLVTKTYKDPIKDGCNILYISNDGNDDDIEAIILQHGDKVNYTREIRGIKTNLTKRNNIKQYLDTLKIVNQTYKYDDKPDVKETKYVVAGPRRYDVYVLNADTYKELKHSSGYSEHAEYEIDKELFDFLKPYMDKNSVITEDRVTKKESSDVYDELGRMLLGM